MTFARCHGNPENDHARAQALLEARQIAVLFPSVRLCAPDALACADSVARELGDAEEPTVGAVEAVVAAVDPAEARRLVESWTRPYPDRWASLVHAAADVTGAERELVRGASMVAILERMPTPRERLVELELVELPPGVALAFVLPPQLVWSLEEAHAAAAALPWAFDDVAAALGRIEHVERVRALATLVCAELPFDGFPRTSAAIEEAADLVNADLGYARVVASLCLEAYVHELSASYTTSRN
jgi:hypothetical protein